MTTNERGTLAAWLKQLCELAPRSAQAEAEQLSMRVTLYLGGDGHVADLEWTMGRGGRKPK